MKFIWKTVQGVYLHLIHFRPITDTAATQTYHFDGSGFAQTEMPSYKGMLWIILLRSVYNIIEQGT